MNRIVLSGLGRRALKISTAVRGSVTELGDEAALEKLVKTSKNLVIDFHAEWCGPCKMMAPHIGMNHSV